MPKNWGVNSKAEEARATKKEREFQRREDCRRQKDDALWEETDARVVSKQKKKVNLTGGV